MDFSLARLSEQLGCKLSTQNGCKLYYSKAYTHSATKALKIEDF
jgi:hypothetical protein